LILGTAATADAVSWPPTAKTGILRLLGLTAFKRYPIISPG